jgi:3'(2'), 5'-bisphosphate nucleotidase
LSAPEETTAPAGHSRLAPFDFIRAGEVLTDAACRAGASIMDYFRGRAAVAFKEDRSPVTEADRASEAIVLEALNALAPDIPVISEEGGGAAVAGLGPDARFFLLDPLDGTKEFIERRTDFTVNIGLIDRGGPLFGLVYAPARNLLALTVAPGEAVEAELVPNAKGADLAALELRPLRTRQPDMAALTAVVSHSHLDPATEAFLAKLKIAARSSAGSSVKLIEIARGEADVYPRFGPTMEWDTAAGHAILDAAGGCLVTTGGGPLRYGKTKTGLRNPGFVAWGTPKPLV